MPLQHQLLAPLAMGLAAAIGYAITPEPSADLAADAIRLAPAPALMDQRRQTLPTVSTLYAADASAYGAHLFPLEEGVALTTDSELTLLRPGQSPKTRSLELGPAVARHGDSIVFWRSGKLLAVPLVGGGERELSPLARMPQHLLGSDTHVAWVERDEAGAFSVHALSAGAPTLVHRARESIRTATIVDETVYAISSSSPGRWTLIAVPLDGRAPTVTSPHAGRPPSMLTAGQDGLYVYAGPKHGVLRLSFDLAREEAVMPGEICTPMAVADRVVCAQVGGLVELDPTRKAPRPLAGEGAGPIASLAAKDTHAYWITDSGAHRLTVRSLARSGP